jgi:hypothetical protein
LIVPPPGGLFFWARASGREAAAQSGIYSPNEARTAENLDAVADDDEPRVQAQVIPLSAAGAIPTAPTPTVPSSAPAAAAKNYQAAVKLELDAMKARVKQGERPAVTNGAAEPDVIRKTRADALQRPKV